MFKLFAIVGAIALALSMLVIQFAVRIALVVLFVIVAGSIFKSVKGDCYKTYQVERIAHISFNQLCE